MFSRDAWFRSFRRSTLAVGLLACLWTASPGLAVPAVQFSSPDVSVSQVTSGGAVAMVYVGHEVDGDLIRRSILFERVVDFDGDGSVSYTSGSALVTKAVWAAVDLTTGSVTVDAPNGFLPTQVTVDPAVLTATEGHVEDTRQSLRLLLVRPGTGAYYGSAFDGAASDFDAGDDGNVRLRLNTMKRLDTGAAVHPKFKAQSGDVLVGIDPEFLTYYVTTVP